MTADLLPKEYDPLPIDVRRGLPQTVSRSLAGRSFMFTWVAGVADLPGLLDSSETVSLLNPAADQSLRPTSVPSAAGDLFRRAPKATLSTDAVRVYLIVREGGNLLGAQPVPVGIPMQFGLCESAGLLVEVICTALQLNVGSLVRPGDIGSRLVAGARARFKGVSRFERSVPPTQGDLYGALT